MKLSWPMLMHRSPSQAYLDLADRLRAEPARVAVADSTEPPRSVEVRPRAGATETGR